jgi:exopolysaccharide production protein ExoZ
MRGMAALIVFMVHFRALFGDRIQPESFLYRVTTVAGGFGHTGVDIFFLLSGFLIYRIVMRDRFRYGNYLLRRLQRLYPTFLFVLGLYLALSAAFPTYSKLPQSIPGSIVYILANLAMLPGIVDITPIITPAWSLSYELAFYVTLPICVLGLGIRRWKSWQRIAFFMFLTALHTTLSAAGIAAHIRLIMFAGGIVLWEVRPHFISTGRLNKWSEYAAIIAFCANLAAIGVLGNSGPMTLVLNRVPYFYSPSLFVTVLFLTLHTTSFDGLLKRIFSWDYLRWVGNMSYSYFLIHGLTLHGIWMLVHFSFLRLPRTPVYFIVLFVFCVVATLIFAAILFLWIEKSLSLERHITTHAKWRSIPR